MLLLTPGAQAAHPLQTEDTATQGEANVEIENGLARTRGGGSKLTGYQVQLSYGLTPTLDALVQPTWLASRDGDGRTLRGWGDTNLDIKWRLYGDAPWSVAVRTGLTLPTGQQGIGLPRGTASLHTLLVATWDAAPFTAHANLGYARWPAATGQRRDAGHASAALMWAATESLTLTAEASADADTERGRSAWPLTLLAGAIITLRPGLDLDIGWQTTARVATIQRSGLLGLTWRFGL